VDKIVAYYRVSTTRQGRSGLGLEAQRQTVADYAAKRADQVVAEFTEIESGRNCERPQLAVAAALARTQRATLVVAKLDRLARDAKFLLGLLDSGVGVSFCDLPDIATHDPITGRLILTVLAAIAEFEARRIGQRVKEAMAVRRRQGKPMGANHPKCKPFAKGGDLRTARGTAAARTVNVQAAKEFRDGIAPLVLRLKSEEGLTNRQIAERLNSLGYATRRGMAWTLFTVSQVLNAKGMS
jgi:DNA invertase Pin-like site-specific DNA recombinase